MVFETGSRGFKKVIYEVLVKGSAVSGWILTS